MNNNKINITEQILCHFLRNLVHNIQIVCLSYLVFFYHNNNKYFENKTFQVKRHKCKNNEGNNSIHFLCFVYLYVLYIMFCFLKKL